MNKKKGQLNNVFVYLLSIIIVVFCGFLVTKFILNFTGDVKDSTNNQIFENLETDFNKVYIKYGAENVNEYKISAEIKYVCFAERTCNSSVITLPELNSNEKQSLNSVIEGNDNVILFTSNGVIGSKNIGEFYLKTQNKCLCIEPKNNRFNLIFTNEKNKVLIDEVK